MYLSLWGLTAAVLGFTRNTKYSKTFPFFFFFTSGTINMWRVCGRVSVCPREGLWCMIKDSYCSRHDSSSCKHWHDTFIRHEQIATRTPQLTDSRRHRARRSHRKVKWAKGKWNGREYCRPYFLHPVFCPFSPPLFRSFQCKPLLLSALSTHSSPVIVSRPLSF